MYIQPMSTVSATEARTTLPDLLDRVTSGEEITITRHGRTVAVLVHPDALRVRKAGRALAEAEQVGALLRRARELPLADMPSISADRADELIAELAATRSIR